MTPPVVQDDLLTVAECAERFRLSQGSVRRLIANGTVPAIRIGSSIRVREVVASMIQKTGTVWSR